MALAIDRPRAAEDDGGRAAAGSLRADSLVGGMALLLLLTVIQRGVGLLRNVIVCRWLEPDDLGLWNLACNFLLLAAPLVVWGIPGSFKRYLEYYRQRGQLRAFVRRSTVVTFGLSAIGVALMLLARRPLAWLVFGDPRSVDLLCLCAVVLVWVIAFNFCTELLMSLRQVRLVSWLQFANSMAFTGAALLLLGTGTWRADGVVLGYGLACGLTAVAGGAAIVWTLRGSAPDENSAVLASFWSRLVPFAAWFWLSDLLTNLFTAVDRYMIVHVAEATGRDGLALVGQYHSSRILAEVLVALVGLLSGVLLPYLSCDWEAGRRDLARHKLDLALQWSSLALTAAGGVSLLAAPWLFQFVLANKYVEGLSVMPLTLVACTWFGLLTMANNYVWCCEKAWLVSLAVGIGLVLNAALNYCWLPLWGLQGAVAAAALANLVTLAAVLGASYALGMRYGQGLGIAIGLPLSLCWGGWTALAIVLLCLCWGIRRGGLIEPADRDRLAQSLSAGCGRFLRRPTLPT